MPTNENTYNSRVTSEALEAKFRQVFPSQGGAELVDDLYASGVIQPVIDFSSVAEGSVLGQNLQTAWDFSTGYTETQNATNTLITNTGFWKVDLIASGTVQANDRFAELRINDGLGNKTIWRLNRVVSGTNQGTAIAEGTFVVYLRAGDSLVAQTDDNDLNLSTWYRQIADVNGNLVNPLGFTFS